MRSQLHEILREEALTALYQPIVDLRQAKVIGYEGLIRGPSDSLLHAPSALFKAARKEGLTMVLERLCRRIVLRQFGRLNLDGKIFLNVSPEALMRPEGAGSVLPQHAGLADVDPDRVIIELTENEPAYDYELLREAAAHYRTLGLRIAIDDLGEGFSSLRLWSELRPEYVKVDMHFIQGIDRDQVKRQFVCSILEIARESGTLVIAEGVETMAELEVVRDIGIPYAQGYLLGRPSDAPAALPPLEIAQALQSRKGAAWLRGRGQRRGAATARSILRAVPTVPAQTSNNQLYDMFVAQPSLQTVTVLDGGEPVGLINRFQIIDRFARPFQRELFGRKPCAHFIDGPPLLVDHQTSLQELSHLIVEGDPQHLSNGFVITENGGYAGVGTGHDLMRAITELQIRAARYANPLTQLPGSVRITEQIDRLIEEGRAFVICYVDLDHFKPFNDLYGYRKGDDAIRIAASLIEEHCDHEHDFVGHIGGDDFIVLFGSEDWEARCRAILAAFPRVTADMVSEQDRARGGYVTEDRRGQPVFHPLVSMSIGAARIDPAVVRSSHTASAAAADAKTQAKKMPGNTLFVERRSAAPARIEQPVP